ncbi:helix-turn-helix transcriptional regulator [Methanolobus halotolerans]|uniref:Transcriptional regulator n=1 Tax=Methanolobus halotolerans TaxID=2052935 RepID=A0A4E0PSX3_9EURY|nr:winged helix-turn-helix domain-containing protein [Methanolobus halotolerans]TGC06996.1 transcriptional regulator [Methanolobus halotolerans]
MKQTLLDVIFASEKRKEVLLLLNERPQEMGHLLKSLNTTRQALLPQIKILENHYLIFHQKDVYELTSIGKLLVEKCIPLVGAIEFFSVDIEYLGTQKLEFIPPHLFTRVNEIGSSEVISPEIAEMYDLNEEFHDTSIKSKSALIISSFLYPNFCELTYELIKNGVEVHLIISPELMDRLRVHKYVNINILLESKLMHVYVYSKELNFLFMGCNDYYLIVNPLSQDGTTDRKYIMSNKKEALTWGRDFFEYYLKDSTPLTQL